MPNPLAFKPTWPPRLPFPLPNIWKPEVKRSEPKQSKRSVWISFPRLGGCGKALLSPCMPPRETNAFESRSRVEATHLAHQLWFHFPSRQRSLHERDNMTEMFYVSEVMIHLNGKQRDITEHPFNKHLFTIQPMSICAFYSSIGSSQMRSALHVSLKAFPVIRAWVRPMRQQTSKSETTAFLDIYNVTLFCHMLKKIKFM